MTSKTIRGGPNGPGQFKKLVISCDTMSCNVTLDDKQIEAGGGLKQLGWSHEARGGKLLHYCPEHTH